MKYIKTYENVISIDLDDEAKEVILHHALATGKVQIIKDILKNGVDPNIMDNVYKSYPILAAQCEKNKPNLEIIQSLIDAGANVNYMMYGDIKIPLISWIADNIRSNTSKTLLMEVFRKLIKAGADLNKRAAYHDKYNFFDEINAKHESKYLTNGFVDRLMKMIQIEAPDQYEIHLMENDVAKYNL